MNMRRTVTLLGVFLLIALSALQGFSQPRVIGARGLILDDGANRSIRINDLNRAIGIGTNNPDPSAILHLDGLGTFGVAPPYGSGVNSADGVGPRGFLLPRLTTAQRNDIENPANGLLIYNTDVGQFQYYNGGTFSWTPMATSGWSVLGNTIPAAGTTPGGNFIGTLNAQDFVIATNVGAPGSGLGERIRVTSAGAVNILTSNAGTTSIGMTGANSSSTAINVGNAGNLLLNNIGPVGAPFEFLTKHIGTNEVKVLGGGGSIAEQGVTFNNEGGNFRFRLGGLANTDNPLLATRYVNLAGQTLNFTNSALANLVQFNGATNAVNINTVTPGNTSIGMLGSTNTITGTANNVNGTNNTITATATNQITGVTNNVNGTNNTLTATAQNTLTGATNLITATGASNTLAAAAGSNLLTSLNGTITVTGGDQTINVPGGGSGNDLIFNGIDITNSNYDLLLINIGTNEVRRRATADLAEQGLIWQTEADGDSKVRLGVRTVGDALGLNALEQERTVYLGSFPLNFSDNAGNPILRINDAATDVVTINGTNAGAFTNIGNNNADDITITTNAATNSMDLVINGLDVPQNDFDLLVINNLAPDINSVTRAAGPAVTEQGITFNNEGGETRIRHGALTAGVTPAHAPFEANRFENLAGFTYNITNSAGQGNDVMASFNGTTNAINFNTIDGGLVTIGNNTVRQHLMVDGVLDGVVGVSTLGGTPNVWDAIVDGDQVTTGLAKFGTSIWVDGYTVGDHRIQANDQLRVWTMGPQDVRIGTNLDDIIEVDGPTRHVGIQLPGAPISPLQVSGGPNFMINTPAADGVHMGQDPAGQHGIELVDNGGLLYIDWTNDFVTDFDARLILNPGTFDYITTGAVLDQQFILNGNTEMIIDGATGNTVIGTNAAPTVNHQLYVRGNSGAPVVANTTGIQTLGTTASNLLTFGQVDASRAWIQSNAQPLTINELGTNVTIGTLAGGHGPSTNTLLGNNNIITSNDDITMTVGTDPGDELTLINIDAPTENIDVLVIHDQAAPNPNWVRRAEENTSQLTEQGITFNNEGGQNRIRLGSLTNGTDANTDAPFEADRFVNLVENELLFTGGAASTFNVLQLEGSSGVVNVMELSSQNAGNTVLKINGPATNGIDIDPVTNGILIDATLLGIDVGTGGNKPDVGINIQPELTGINIDGQASTTMGVNIDMSAPTLTNGGTAFNANIVGSGPAGVTDVNGAVINASTPDDIAVGANITTSTTLGGSSRGLIVQSSTAGGGYVEGATINATQNGTNNARGASIDMTATNAASGNIEGLVLTANTSSTVGSIRGLFTQAQKFAASGLPVTGGGFNTIGNGAGLATGITSFVSGSTGGNTAGLFNATPAGAGTVLGLNVSATGSTSSSVGAALNVDGTGTVEGILLNATNTGAGAGLRGMVLTTNRTGGGALGATGLDLNTQANGTGLVRGILSVTNPSGTGSVIGVHLATSGQPGAPATGVTGISNDVANSGAVSDVTGIVTTVNDLAGAGGVATGGSFTVNGGGFSANATGITTTASGGTANNTAISANVSGTNNIGVDVTHAAGIGLRIQGGNTAIINDGANFLGNDAGNDQLIVMTGTGPTTINTDANDVTIITDPGSGTGNDLIISGIDQNPASPFDIMVIQDAGNEVRRANSDGSNEITEQGITFNTEGGQTRIRLGDLAAGTGVSNSPFEADRIVNLVQNELRFTGGAASASNVLEIEGNAAGALNQVEMTSLNATNTSVLKLNGPAVTGLDIDPVQFGIRIDATNTLIQQTGSQPVNGLDMQVGVTGTGILLNDNDGVPSTVGANLGVASVLLTGVRTNATTGFLSQNTAAITFTSFRGDGAGYFGDNNGIDEFIVLADDGRIELNSAHAGTGIDITTTAAGGDGIDIVATGAGEDVDIFGNQDITLFAFTNSIIGDAANDIDLEAGDDMLLDAGDVMNGTAVNNINLTSSAADITLTAFDDNILSATDNSVTATTGSNTVTAAVNNVLNAVINDLNATDDNTLDAGDDNILTATSDNILNAVINDLNASNDNTLDAGDDNILTATDDNVLNATDNSITATTGSNTVTAAVNNVLNAVINDLNASNDNTLDAGDDNILTATDDNVLSATDNSITATTGNNTLAATLGDNIINAGDDNLLTATDNSVIATTGNNSLTANTGNNQLTATLGDNIISGTDNLMNATSGNNALTANVNNTFTATTGNNSFNAAVNNTFTATGGNNTFVANQSNTFTATNVNNTFTATLGDNLFSATDNSMTATSGDNTFTALSGENYLNAPLNRVGGVALPTSTLHVTGSVAAATTAGGTTALTVNQFFYLVTANGQTITLPNATLCQGRIYVIKNDNLSSNTTVNSAGGNIDGGAAFVQVAANAAVQYISDGANWWIMSTN